MTVLLLHALPLDERMWEPQRAAFPDAVTPRLYGRGPSTEGWARGILAEVEGELAVVGASMGGYCALEVVRQAPGRVRALVLVGSRVEADSPERREGRTKTLELIRSGGAEALWEDMRPKLFPPGETEAVAFARSLALEQRPDELAAAVEGIRDRRDATEVVAGFERPVLFSAGRDDPFVAPNEAPPSVEVHSFDTGHLPSLERPEEFNAVLAEFLARV
jgi:pimeloyl-ACP methyl ester carboxylesterase